MRILITGGTGFMGSNILNDRNFCQNNKFLILYKRKKYLGSLLIYTKQELQIMNQMCLAQYGYSQYLILKQKP